MKKFAFFAAGAFLALPLTACGGGESNPLGDLSGPTISGKAFRNLKAASSVHYSGKITAEGVTTTVDISVAKGNCSGTIGASDEGGYEVKRIGKNVWFALDETYMASKGLTDTPEKRAMVTGKWFHTTTGDDGPFGSMAAMCDITTTIDTALGDPSTVAKTPRYTKVTGKPVVEITGRGGNAQLVVTNDKHPYPLSLTVSDTATAGKFTFSKYGSPLVITAPPADSVAEVSALTEF